MVDLDTEIRHVLEAYPQIQFATLFGSVTCGQMTDQSDIDIAVAAQTALLLDVRIELADQLTQALHREIDLIDLPVRVGNDFEAKSGSRTVNPQERCWFICRAHQAALVQPGGYDAIYAADFGRTSEALSA
jgi:predicted nucleotidyltransferase